MKALVLGTLLAAAQQPQQFDLVCKGYQETVRFRVDLGAGQWCWEDCRGTWPIAKVTDTVITFKEQDTPSIELGNMVDRRTGRWSYFLRERLFSHSDGGPCEPAPFSGFPKVETKF